MKSVVFDFDGTIADSIPAMLELYNQHAAAYGLRTVTADEFQQERDMSFRQILEFLGVKPHQLPKLLTLGMKLLHEQAHKIKPFPGMPEVLKQLHETGWRIYILSSNAEVTVQKVIDEAKLEGYVQVLKSSKMFGKAQALNKLKRRDKLDFQAMWMVGDEVRDIQAANKVGARSLAVGWGFHSERRLQSVNPTAVARTPEDIPKILAA